MISLLKRGCPLLIVAVLAACDSTPAPAPAEKTKRPSEDAANEQANANPAGPAQDPEGPPAHKATPHFSGRSKVAETTVSGEGEGPYHFTAWWHKKRAATWDRELEPFKGRAQLRYLEVGVFEGRSLIWMLENVLTHPTATATAIDPFMDEYEATYDANIVASGASERVTKIKASSQTALRELPLDSFDIIYVDGSHTADDVLVDAIMSWDLLRVGGMIIFDDYGWSGRPGGAALPPELVPRVAIDVFVMAHRYEIEIVDRGAQMLLRKLDNPCQPKDYCSPVGQYLYFWREYELRDGNGSVVPLSPDEITLIERLAKARRAGEVAIRLDKTFRETREFIDLQQKLALDLSAARAPELAPR